MGSVTGFEPVVHGETSPTGTASGGACTRCSGAGGCSGCGSASKPRCATPPTPRGSCPGRCPWTPPRPGPTPTPPAHAETALIGLSENPGCRRRDHRGPRLRRAGRRVRLRWGPRTERADRHRHHRGVRPGRGGATAAERIVRVPARSEMAGRRRPDNRQQAACPSAQSTFLLSNSSARVTAWAILTRILEVPAAAASANHSLAPSPRARNSTSAALRGSGFRFNAPGRCGREVGVDDSRGSRRCPGVVGDLHRTVRADVDHDHVLVSALAVHPHPHRFPEQGVRHRVLPALERDHRGNARHDPGHPERDCVRDHRGRVQREEVGFR